MVIVTSVAASLQNLLVGQPRRLAEDFDVTLVTSPTDGETLAAIEAREGVPVQTVRMSRRITPLADGAAAVALTQRLRRLRPALVQTYTPKAGLVGMLAARAAGVPVRIHGIVGMPLMEARGTRRLALQLTERLTYAAATDLTCNSYGLRSWVQAELTTRAISVIGEGSINGIDTVRWAPDPALRSEVRARFGLGATSTVLVFVGRMVRDKGVVELVEAFVRWRRGRDDRHLVFVGAPEPELDPLPATTRSQLDAPGIHCVGLQSDVRPFLAAADAFVLPSYREGLPNSLLEAGAMGLPAVATDINGCNEVIAHGETGHLVPPKTVDALVDAFNALVDEGRRCRMGEQARRRVVERYDQRAFHRALVAYYADRVRAAASVPSPLPELGDLAP